MTLLTNNQKLVAALAATCVTIVLVVMTSFLTVALA